MASRKSHSTHQLHRRHHWRRRKAPVCQICPTTGLLGSSFQSFRMGRHRCSSPAVGLTRQHHVSWWEKARSPLLLHLTSSSVAQPRLAVAMRYLASRWLLKCSHSSEVVTDGKERLLGHFAGSTTRAGSWANSWADGRLPRPNAVFTHS